MANRINNTDRLIDFIFNRNKISDKQLLKVIGTGHGYTSGGVIERSGGHE